MKSNTFYFTHDFNAHHDPKIESMIFADGWQAYGLYWAIIEKLAQEPTHKMRTHYDRIAFALQTQSETIKKIIECYELFVIENDLFWSERLIKHFSEREIKSEKAKVSANKRWGEDANAMQTHSERNAIKERKVNKRKVNKRKEKEIKGNIITRTKFVAPTIADVVAYFSINNFQKDPERFWNYYESNGWKVGKNPMKRWDLTANNWEKSDYGEGKTNNGYQKESKIKQFFREVDNAQLG